MLFAISFNPFLSLDENADSRIKTKNDYYIDYKISRKKSQ